MSRILEIVCDNYGGGSVCTVDKITELVRCKDCKHFQEDECPWTGVIDFNGFCSKGERKEIEDEDRR